MSKYIIKNCPATKGTNGFCADERTEVFCEDVTDCLLKQIVEKCYDYKLYSSQDLAEEILSMLEIQECE